MRLSPVRGSFAAFALFAVVCAADTAGTPWRSFKDVPACAGLSSTDDVRLAHGAIVARTLPGSSAYETVAAGGVRIHVSPDAYIAAFREIVAFKGQSDYVLQIGVFSDPPRQGDVATLTIDDADFAAMRRCRTGDCGVKLASPEIDRLRTEVNWNSPEARHQATGIVQQMLVHYVEAYRAGGDRALGDYADKQHPVRLADEFSALVQGSTCISDIAPELRAYLRDYPRGALSRSETFFYWSKETFGMKPMISVTHVVIYRPAPGIVLLASKGIYSSHYIEASLGLAIINDASSPSGPAIDLLYVNRSRADALRSSMAFFAKGTIARRQRDGLIRELRALRSRLEAGAPVR